MPASLRAVILVDNNRARRKILEHVLITVGGIDTQSFDTLEHASRELPADTEGAVLLAAANNVSHGADELPLPICYFADRGVTLPQVDIVLPTEPRLLPGLAEQLRHWYQLNAE